MKDYWGLIAIAILVASGVLLAACGITDPGNWVHVPVPAGLREVGEPAKVSVNEAESIFRVKASELEIFADNIAGGQAQAAAWRGVIGSVANTVEVGAASIPGWSVYGGAAILGGIFGALGIKRPGDKPASEVKTIADADYDAGKSDALALIEKAKNLV